MLARLGRCWSSVLLVPAHWIALVTLLVLGFSCSDLTPPSADRVFRGASPGVFVISVGGPRSDVPVRLGSGVAIAGDLVVTNRHVVGALHPALTYLTVSQGNRAWAAFPLHFSRSADLCTLIVPGLAATPVTLAPSAKLKAGAKVFAIGAPHGLELTITEGLVSGVRHLEREEGPGLIQISAPISPGSSGGGLFDRRGRLVGITTSFVQKAQGLSFAVPEETLANEFQALGYGYTSAFAMAIAYSESGDFSRARALLRQAVHLQGDFSEGWLALGYLEVDDEAKIEAFQRAVTTGPDVPGAWAALGEALASQADGTESQYGLGMLVGKEEDIKSRIKAWRIQAASALETALRLDGADAEVWLQLGDVYDDLEDLGQASRAYGEVLRLVPGHLKAMTHLCLVYRHSSQPRAAIAQCSEVIRYAQLRPDSADRTYALMQSWLNLHLTLWEIGDLSGSRKAKAQWLQWSERFNQDILTTLQNPGKPDPDVERRRSARNNSVRALIPILERRLKP